MKSYTVNECEFCGFKSTDEKEVFQHEAAHLGLTVGEYETYWALKHKVKYFANPANVENTEIRTKIYNQAFTKLANFEKEHNITGNTYKESKLTQLLEWTTNQEGMVYKDINLSVNTGNTKER